MYLILFYFVFFIFSWAVVSVLWSVDLAVQLAQVCSALLIVLFERNKTYVSLHYSFYIMYA